MAAPQQSKILTGSSAAVGATVDSSSNATIYSTPFAVNHSDNWAVHFEWTGTPTSTLSLWSTCKPNPSLASDTDWVEDATITFTNPAGSASKALKEIGNSGAYMYRIKVVTASGSGTISAWVHAK